MAKTMLKNTQKAVKKNAQLKAIKKNEQVKAVRKAAKTLAKRTGTRTRAAAVLAVGATGAAGAWLVRRRGGPEEVAPQADLTDPAVAAGV